MPAAVILAALFLLPAASHAAREFEVTLSAGATHSDNIARTGAGEESETTADAGLRLTLVNDEGRLQSNIGADLLFRHYTDDAFDDELSGSLDGTLAYWFAQDRFGWVFQNSHGQTLIDPREVDTAGNRQNLNYFSTGPDIVLRLGSRTRLNVQGRWSDTNYEEGDIDNERLTGSLALVRLLSESSSVSLNGSASRIEYDRSPPNSDYDTHSVFVGYDARGARTTLSLQAGYTALRDFGDSSDGPLVTIRVSRQVSERSTLSLSAGTNLVDTAEAFRRDFEIGGPGPGTGDAIASRDPFQSDYLSFAWDAQGARTALRLAVDWRKEDHELDTSFDRERLGAQLSVTRQLGPRLSGRLSGGWNTQDFDASGLDFDEWSAGAGLDWNVARTVSLSLHADHFRGSGDTLAGPDTRDYDENRISLRILFQPTR